MTYGDRDKPNSQIWTPLAVRCENAAHDVEQPTTMALPAPVGDEGKMLSEALNICKIQTQQMKRFLVRVALSTFGCRSSFAGDRPAHGCAQEREHDAGRAADILAVSETVL